MKYIRTKDEIWEIMEIKPDYEKTYYHCKHNLIGKRFEEIDIIKEADMIEDLCDRFIVEYESDNFTIFTDFRDLKKHFEYYPQDYHNVVGRYGAMLVKGKGLIYKAKMNNEGKLELL